LIENGIDLEELATTVPGEIISSGKVRERYTKVRSAGQGVGMVNKVEPTSAICKQLIAEYGAAKTELLNRIHRSG
jgi:nitronate monooxygenase